jgi:tRNA(Ile)-lysidine synthase
VAEFITRYSMFRHGARVGVAVSGGADSVCLLHLLREIAPRWNLHMYVLHLNHGLRGEESDADEQSVRELAHAMGLPIKVATWAGPAAGDNLEQAARERRLSFFRDAMESEQLERVALGHTRSDQAETVLFRLLRGAGTAGLAGIRPTNSAGIVRPLLCVTRQEVETWLRERGLSWHEDSSNATSQFARNRIRHELLPFLAREWNPAIAETLADTAAWAQAEETYWEAEIERLAAVVLSHADRAILLNTRELAALPLAAARRLMRRAMENVKGDLRGINFGHVEAALTLASGNEGHGRFQAPGLDVYRSFDWMRIAPPGIDTLENRNYGLPAPVPGSVEIPNSGRRVILEVIDTTRGTGPVSDSVYNDGVGCVDWERVSGPLELRNWRPGDQYQPFGYPHEEKIKTLFQKARVPLWERRHWPVLTDGFSIVWARRFGPAASYAADGNTRTALTIRESGSPVPSIERSSEFSSAGERQRE